MIGERLIPRHRVRRPAGQRQRARACGRGTRFGGHGHAIAVSDPRLPETTQWAGSPRRPADHLLAAPYDVAEPQHGSINEPAFALSDAPQHQGVEVAGRQAPDLLSALVLPRPSRRSRMRGIRASTRGRLSSKRQRRLERLRLTNRGGYPRLGRLLLRFTCRRGRHVRRRRRRSEGMRLISTSQRTRAGKLDLRFDRLAAAHFMRRVGAAVRETPARVSARH